MADWRGSAVISFGPYELSLQSRELRRNGAKIRLQDQPFQVLALLLERPGEVVSREELRAKLWPIDTFVDFDHGLNAAVKRLRDALGDSAERPRFIETLARRGYRFIAPVTQRPPISNGDRSESADVTSPAINGTVPLPASVVSRPTWAIRARTGWTKAAAALAVLAMGTGAGWVAARRLNPRVQIIEQRLTANALGDPVLCAAISPDSKYLAFADRAGFFLRVIGTGETHSIAGPQNLKLRPAGWFPDGTHILVTNSLDTAEAQHLWSLSVLGGAPRKLVDNAMTGAISPDGSQLAFLRGGKTNEEIWLASLSTSEPQSSDPPKILVQPETGLATAAERLHHQKILGDPGDLFGAPAWSPDGSRFAFTRYVYRTGYRDGDVSIGICDPATRHVDFVLSDRRLGDSLAWTADGRLIYSLSEPPPNQRDSNLWAQQIDLRAGGLSGEPKRLTAGPDVKNSLTFSADGKRLSFLRRSSEPHIFVSEIEPHSATAPPRLTTPQSLSLGEGRNFPFTWTADSKSLLFISDRNGPFHLFKQSLDQPAPDLLADGQDAVMIARLNPDGSEVLFLTTPAADDPAGQVRLLRMPVSGGTPQLVLLEPEMENIQCARLPSKLCLFSRNEPHAISFFRFDSVTGAKQELTQYTRTTDLKFNWTLSADGSLLALAAWRPGKPAQIELLPLNPPLLSQRRSLQSRISKIELPNFTIIRAIDWAADSRHLWVSAYDASGTDSLLLVGLDGKISTMLQDSQRELGWAIPAPDGKHVALWQASGSSNAWLLQGF